MRTGRNRAQRHADCRAACDAVILAARSILFLETTMLRWALIFAVIAVVAGLFGFTGIEAGAADIARAIFYVFVGLVVVFLVLGVTIFKKL